MPEGEKITISGARVHNLKDIDLAIPRDKLVVITGLSGSGKSSLAFDTICAEGQRRYMDTLSAYARQFIGILERPDIDEIKGLSPVISIEQKTVGRNPRSTVGTITEIYDFFRLLYARASQAFSPESGKEMVRYTDEEIINLILQRYEGQKVILLAPLVRGRKGHYRELFVQLQRRGYNQVRIDGQLCDLSETGPLDRYKIHFVELVVDKLIPRADDRKRIKDSVTNALNQGKGALAILSLEDNKLQHFSRNLVCPDTGLSYDVPAPYTFSFNSPQGACPHCRGLGTVARVDLSKIIPDRSRSIADGGIESVGAMRGNTMFRYLDAIARRYKFSLHAPISEIPEEALQVILYGTDELLRIGTDSDMEMASFPGVLAQISLGEEEESERKKTRKELFVEEMTCPVCGGTRLKAEALNFKIDGKNIAEVSNMDIDALYDWVRMLPERLSQRQMRIAEDILKELVSRIGFLKDVGLEYLSLSRATRSLSGGESQRIRLATQIGSSLMGVLYILDEPSIGLHQRDNDKLLETLKRLRGLGNTLIVVEHDEDTIRAADYVVDVGPGAGVHGGEIVAQGSIADLIAEPRSITGQYLSGNKTIPIPSKRRKGSGKTLKVFGCRENNLQGVDVSIPLGTLTCVTGVSGSGKSSLVNEIIYKKLAGSLNHARIRPGKHDRFEGIEALDKVIAIDQSPIGRTPRSNPATYTGLFNDIRDLFASTNDAKLRGYGPGRFSFNTKGGRCEACGGDGLVKIEMHFLPDVYVPCDVCRGRRYNRETLEVRYKGLSIADVLDLTCDEALEYFRSLPRIRDKVQTMVDVGLGYIKLGQSSTTLSGGEAQRVKLATELSRRSTGSTFYILDEPTTGLHMDDVKKLIDVLQKLVDAGNTVLVIEHNLDVIKCADHLIDLGPEGGDGGGRVVASGTPEQAAENPASFTGQYLARILK